MVIAVIVAPSLIVVIVIVVVIRRDEQDVGHRYRLRSRPVGGRRTAGDNKSDCGQRQHPPQSAHHRVPLISRLRPS
ncbi:hypothetical protein [Nonomuraea fuscirosea]|uniref:hypothetical protein n=1 Tax=Nonomuraea fuscirosea TaxID=1291556 RepID=UPI000D04F5BA|nr:hypothetical protein [Nonomuraea fuscirosea]